MNSQPNLDNVQIELQQWEEVERSRRPYSQAESCLAILGSDGDSSSMEQQDPERGVKRTPDGNRIEITRVITQSSDGMGQNSPISPMDHHHHHYHAR